MNEFQVTGNTAHFGPLSASFSSHLAAFEACMRIREPEWKPIGGGTYFQSKRDRYQFVMLRDAVTAL